MPEPIRTTIVTHDAIVAVSIFGFILLLIDSDVAARRR
jgi:hypothetical protein